MKKLKLLLSLSILFFTFYSCNEQLEISNLESLDSKAAIIKPFESLSQDIPINYCGEPVECTLIAGQSIDAGTVTIMNDGVNLYVKVFSIDGFQDVEENIKMWIGTEIPSKRPPAGHFPYKVTESGNTHIFQIPLSSLDGWTEDECEQEYIIIVHADVKVANGDGFDEETAFGGCIEGGGRAWWYYMEYTTACCEEEEIGFLYKTTNPELWVTCFEDNDVFGFSNEIHYSWLLISNPDYPIWTNIEDDCGIDKIGYVGDIYFKIINQDSDPEVELILKMRDDHMMKDVNIYVGWENPVFEGNLVGSVVFDNITVDAEVHTYTKKITTWAGSRPVGDNPPFYVIVKMDVD